jgi:hypothetical protein
MENIVRMLHIEQIKGVFGFYMANWSADEKIRLSLIQN